MCGKMVLGRSSIGRENKFDNHQGYEHWNEMKENLGIQVEKWHDLN